MKLSINTKEKTIHFLEETTMEEFSEFVKDHSLGGYRFFASVSRNELHPFGFDQGPISIGNMLNKNTVIAFAAEYAYRKANPDSKMDVPNIVYEDAEKDLERFLKEKKLTIVPTTEESYVGTDS